MGLISNGFMPDHLPSKEDICGTTIPIAKFPIFTKIDPLDVLAYYLASCIGEEIDPLNLPNTYPNTYGKRKKRNEMKDAQEEGSSELRKKNKKVEMFLDKDDMPLSECQKAMILKDTYGVAQQSSKASIAPIPGKSPTTITIFVSDSNVFESVLPTPPPPCPSHNTFTPSSLTIPNPIP